MRNRAITSLLSAILLMCAVSVPRLFSQSAQPDTPQVGYAIISPGPGISAFPPGLEVFETFGFVQGDIDQQAQTPAAQMTTSALLFVNLSDSLGRNIGIAVANPNTVTAQINMTLLRDDGIITAVKTIFVLGRQQLSQLVTELFSDQMGIPKEFTGTLKLESSVPVAVIASRFRGSSFSTETLSQLSAPSPIPPIVPGAGGGPSFILPGFVVGGGFATEILIISPSSFLTPVRLDLFSANGSPLTLTLNGATGSTFTNFLIQPGGVLVIAPLNSQGNSQF